MKSEKNIIDQLYKAKEYVVKHTGPVGNQIEKVVARKWIQDIEHTVDVDVDAEIYHPEVEKERLPKVAIIVYALIMGGGEIFPVNLANALVACSVPTILINCNMLPTDPKVRGMLDPAVSVIDIEGYRNLGTVLNRERVDIVHTHHAAIDLAVSRLIATGKINAGQVVTLHGMYEALDVPRCQMIIDQVNQTCRRYAYIADKNLLPFCNRSDYRREQFVKVPNGMPKGVDQTVTREDLGIPEDAFVLCLVSRALFAKGWEQAIRSVKLANKHSSREIHLILVGDGEAYDKFHEISNPYIHFTGAKQNTRAYFAISDVGFLPSWYSGESFPLVVIDSLMCEKPVLATKVGEIPVMIHSEDGDAGWLLPREDGTVSVQKLAKKILKISQSEELYRKARVCCAKAVEPYDILEVAKTYLNIYQNVMNHLEEREYDNPKCKILISCHKEAKVPRTSILTPIEVGSALHQDQLSGMIQDDQGDNISDLNPMYCEMTAQYWAWKNLDADYYGFFHYRRYLNLTDKKFHEDRYGNIYEPVLSEKVQIKYGLTDSNITNLIKDYDIVTVEGRKLPCSVAEQYCRGQFLHKKDLKLMISIINKLYPDYHDVTRNYLKGHVAYFCNMYIMKADLFKEYCAWVFPILEEFCEKAEMNDYSKEELRTPGHLAERLWGIYYSNLKEKGIYRTIEKQPVLISHTEMEESESSKAVLNTIRKVGHVIDDIYHRHDR